MPTIPKLTNPLTKAIRTLEGILVTITTFILMLGALIPSHVIPPKWAAIVVAVMNVALMIQRAVIKVAGIKAGAAVASVGVVEAKKPA